jgi:hypothetical protein
MADQSIESDQCVTEQSLMSSDQKQSFSFFWSFKNLGLTYVAANQIKPIFTHHCDTGPHSQFDRKVNFTVAAGDARS